MGAIGDLALGETLAVALMSLGVALEVALEEAVGEAFESVEGGNSCGSGV